MSELTVVVEGWRFLPHSYSIVSQYLCLEFLKQPGLHLFHRDCPPFRPEWTPQRGLLTAAEEERIAAIPAPPADLVPDVVFRCVFPYDLAPARAGRTFVQVTAELGMMPDQCMVGSRPFGRAHATGGSIVVTPSAYCRDGLVVAGGDPSRIAVVPHGVDTATFKPLDIAERERLRRELQWDGRFVFMNVGTITENKGPQDLLSAFAVAAAEAPQAILFFKGLDGLYKSSGQLGAALHRAGLAKAPVTSQIRYDGNARSAQELARLYAAADAYVSPYLAEGFNIPVLEAAACGLPVICTAGGPTDEFTIPDFAMRIPSTRGPSPWGVGESLSPDRAAVADLMQTVMRDAAFRQKAARSGPLHVRAHYSWARAAAAMIALFKRPL